MIGNFHAHTSMVDGANTAEEMVQSAIRQGLTVLGFSEHAYTPLDPDCCLSKNGTMKYRKEIARLKEKYAGQIRLLCGIELDSTSKDDPTAYEYVIGSVHYLTIDGQTYSVDLSPEETKRCIDTAFLGDKNRYAEAYFMEVADMVERVKPDIIGHFDLITKFQDRGVAFDFDGPRYKAAWQTAMQSMVGKGVLEVNTGAMSRGYRAEPYPTWEMLTYWNHLGGEIVLSSDSHHQDTLLYGFAQAEELVKKAGFITAGFTDKKGVTYTQLGE